MTTMLENPLTLLTGFGWNASAAMPFRWGTHNHYLWAWFNLGVPGLVCSVLLLVVPIKVALSASRVANAATRPYLMGFVVGMTCLAVSVFFVNLSSPWLYVWVYVGIVMRIAVNAAEEPVTVPAAVRAAAVPASEARDAHGWSAITSR
jgi:O-antigen ligase